MRILRLTVVGTALLITTLPSTLSGGQLSAGQRNQPTQQQTGPYGATPSPGALPDFGPNSPKIEEQQAKARSNERQKKLVADTDKLLALATELKTDVDKTNQNILSMDVIKKAEEIEKLAHSVKERMKG
jgi:hypothetical protein